MTRAIYIVTNKNDDDWHAERVKHDPDLCEAWLTHASKIIFSDVPPMRIAEDPESKVGKWHCTFCPAKPICHDSQFARVNCRTCMNVTPKPTGGWRCDKYQHDLTLKEERTACLSHLYNPHLVPGNPIDSGTDPQGHDWIEYVLNGTGEIWIDTVKEQERELTEIGQDE